jgi:hypothetical protein
MSLTCGLLATLLQQWARRYIKITQPPYGPRKRARIRAFFAEGVEKWHLPWAVEALPTLLHLSLFFFFAGLLVLLVNTDYAVFGIVAGWVSLCIAVYGCITLIPIFRHDSPYCSPLSSLAWSLFNSTICVAIRTLYSFGVLDHLGYAIRDRMLALGMLSKRRCIEGMVKTAEDTALKISSEIDARALMWTLNSLDEDHELERFFAGIPGFCNSKVVSNPLLVFIEPNKWTLSEALIGLMHRTLTSGLVGESVRRCRALICTKAAHSASLPIQPTTCEQVINGWLDGLLNFVEFGQFLRRDDHNDPSMAYYSNCMVSIIIARVKERDDLWFELAMGHLGVSAPVLRDYLAHGDSALLANYNHILRDIVRVHFEHFQSGDAASRWKALESVSQFDIQDTLPSLQHDFCELWNEIVHMAGTTPDHRIRSILIVLLKNVRCAYTSFHEGTDSAPTAFSASTADDEHVLFLLSSYPLCNTPGHRPHPASHTRVEFSNATAPTSLAQTFDLSPFSMSHNTFPFAAPLSYTPQTQMGVEGHQFPPVVASSSDSTRAAPAHDVANMLPQFIPGSITISIPQPVHSSSFSETATPLHHVNAHAFPHPMMQDGSSPTFCLPVFDNTTMPQSVADPATSRSDDAHSTPNSPFSIPATAFSTSTPALPPSAIYRGAAHKRDRSEKSALFKGKDLTSFSPKHRDCPSSLQLPPPSLVEDVAVPDPLRPSQDAG